MKVKLTGYVRHNGARHAPGSVLSLPDDEAKRLVGLGVATPVQEPKAPPPPPPDPTKTGPELIADMTVREAAEALALIQDPEFIRQVVALEQAKEDPRSTLIEAAERRIAELTGGE